MSIYNNSCNEEKCSKIGLKDGYCLMHFIIKPKKTKKELYPHHQLYKSVDWLNLRRYHLTQQPICVVCGRSGIEAGGLHVDHIVDHKGDIDIFYDKTNLQTLCSRCHGRKSIEVIRMKSFKKDIRVVNIEIDPESKSIENAREALGYESVTPELLDTIVKGNTNDKFVVDSKTRAKQIAQRYQLTHRVKPKFNIVIKAKDVEK